MNRAQGRAQDLPDVEEVMQIGPGEGLARVAITRRVCIFCVLCVFYVLFSVFFVLCSAFCAPCSVLCVPLRLLRTDHVHMSIQSEAYKPGT